MDNQKFQTFSKYIKSNVLTISEEDYLEMIYRLCIKKDYTRVNDLSKALNVKPPSVSKMMKSLNSKNLIKHFDYGTIQLTDEGKNLGKYLIERHLIIEKFLELLNIKDNILEETEKIEHTLSPDTIDKIKLLVDFAIKKNILVEFKKFLDEEDVIIDNK
jgi:Mn-dependent DtxR family transcriptional regulator